jgi:hypothetical protein
MMEKTMTAQCEIAAKMYKNMKMGSESIGKLIDKVPEGQMRGRMLKQLNGYEGFAAKAKMMLSDNGEEAKEESPMTKFWATVGMKMNTLIDSSQSHIAQIMIEGSTMGVTDTTKVIHEYEGNPECRDVLDLARDIVKFEEQNIEDMKKFL